MGSMAVALCTLLVLLFGRLPQHVYVSPQEPAEGEQVPGRDIGQRQARVHRLIPPKPFKRQKIAPCDKQNGEETINGGCWYGGRDPGPDGCGSKEYEDQRGKCWRWVEDSTQPSADVPTDGGTGYGGAGEKLTPRFP
jgi:hypothetical protein